MTFEESKQLGCLNRESKELIFFNDLWDILSQQTPYGINLQNKGQKTRQKIKIEVAVSVLIIVLNPVTTLKYQAGLIVTMSMNQKSEEVKTPNHYDKELRENVLLNLALLRELHPCYYDCEYLNFVADSLRMKVKNFKQISTARAKELRENSYDFQPKISLLSH